MDNCLDFESKKLIRNYFLRMSIDFISISQASKSQHASLNSPLNSQVHTWLITLIPGFIQEDCSLAPSIRNYLKHILFGLLYRCISRKSRSVGQYI
jgi:hypothetical protein